jgi:hypothetical protein
MKIFAAFCSLFCLYFFASVEAKADLLTTGNVECRSQKNDVHFEKTTLHFNRLIRLSLERRVRGTGDSLSPKIISFIHPQEKIFKNIHNLLFVAQKDYSLPTGLSPPFPFV